MLIHAKMASFFLHRTVAALLYLDCRFLGLQLLHILQNEYIPVAFGHIVVAEITMNEGEKSEYSYVWFFVWKISCRK